MRSEVELRVGPRGRACPPSQVSSPKSEEGLLGPQVLREAPETLAVGRAVQNGDWRWEDLEINSQVEGLGRRPWLSPQETPILKEERETRAPPSLGKEDT